MRLAALAVSMNAMMALAACSSSSDPSPPRGPTGDAQSDRQGTCGDGITDTLETCDDGFTDACGSCNATCTGAGSGGFCGDGALCPEFEFCEDGFSDACGSCGSTCTGAGTGSSCGDGIVCPEFEACDDGFTDACGSCNTTCIAVGSGSSCGDGTLCPEFEFCDDGFSDTCGFCNGTCTVAGTGSSCGDGVFCPELEACDDGFTDPCGSCNMTCTWAGTGSSCGDSTVCPEFETCDDGNVLANDACASCQRVEFRVNTSVLGDQTSVAVAALGAEGFVAVWQSRGSDVGVLKGILAQRYDDDGVKVGGQLQINQNPHPTDNSLHISVAAIASGEFVVVWDMEGGTDRDGKGIVRRLFDVGGSPSTPDLAVNTTTAGRQMNPDVGLALDGSIVVVWENDSGNETYSIRAQRFSPDGATIGSEFQINLAPNLGPPRPSVSMFSNGDFIVVWQKRNPDAIWMRRFRSDGVPLDEIDVRVSLRATEYKFIPDVAVAPGDSFAIAWAGENPIEVWGRFYSPTAQPVSSEFKIASTAFSPSVASLSTGEFLVGWQSTSSSNSEDIYAQRFSAGGAATAEARRVPDDTLYRPHTAPAVAGMGDTPVTAWVSAGGQDTHYAGIYCKLGPY